MGIDFVVAKIRHAGPSDANLLIPYLNTCHVVLPENTCVPEEECKRKEDTYKDILTSSMCNKQKRHLQKRARELNNPKDETFRAYDARLQELLLKHKMPLVFLERWPSSQEANMTSSYHRHAVSHANYETLLGGNYLPVLIESYNAISRCIQHIRLRDEQMGICAHSIEDRIVALYPQLKAVPRIRALVPIGAAHMPERYLKDVPDATVSVHNHVHDWEMWVQYYKSARYKEEIPADFESAKQLLARNLLEHYLEYAFKTHPTVVKNMSPTPLSYHLVMKMGINDLQEISSELARVHDPDPLQRAQIIFNFFDRRGIQLPATSEEYRRMLTSYKQQEQ
ncbi:hypothetical protein HZC31_02420 [Candidatus Woesearchaeota archaeon]|nr:hypothetical protein [Candidatus Woesearchaeota archaeon]